MRIKWHWYRPEPNPFHWYGHLWGYRCITVWLGRLTLTLEQSTQA